MKKLYLIVALGFLGLVWFFGLIAIPDVSHASKCVLSRDDSPECNSAIQLCEEKKPPDTLEGCTSAGGTWDTTGPTCGTFSAYDSNGWTTLTGSVDNQGGSGLDTNYSVPADFKCYAPPGWACSVQIRDRSNPANYTTCLNPVNRPGTPDTTKPICGTFSAYDDDGWTTLTGSQDNEGGTGLDLSYSDPSGFKCKAPRGEACSVKIRDKSNPANSETCTNPTRRDFEIADPDEDPPVCGTFSAFDVNGYTTLSGSYDSRSSPVTATPSDFRCYAQQENTCKVTIRDAVDNERDCTSPSRPAVVPPGTFTCSADPSSVTSGSSTTFSVLDTTRSPQNSGSYTWSITGSDSTGVGTTFTTVPTRDAERLCLGTCSTTRTATVTAGTQSTTCSVVVKQKGASLCSQYIPTIDIYSNLPTTWTLVGPETQTQSTAKSGSPSPMYPGYMHLESYGQMPYPGTYTLYPEEKAGYSVSVSVSNVQTLDYKGSSCNPGADGDFVITYTAITTPVVNGTIRVVSNQPTTWNLNDRHTIQATPSTGQVYTDMTPGNWTISGLSSLAGFQTPTVAPSSIQTLGNAGDITFTINYQPGPSCNATLAISPLERTVMVNATTTFRAIYDADGNCSQSSPQDVEATWSSLNSQISSFVSKTTDGLNGIFRGVSIGVAGVKAVYQGLTADNASVIVVEDSPTGSTLTVTLTATPPTGDPVLPVTLTATVGGTATGTINYTFWKNCSAGTYAGTDVATAESACGTAPSHVFKRDNVSEVSLATDLINYSTGNFVPLVIVERGDKSARATASVVVDDLPTNNTLTVSLTANPSSGQPDLSSRLTATVGGTATGTINYTFWKDCDAGTYSGTSVAEAQSACGTTPSYLKKDGQSATSFTTESITYSRGSFVPLVIVERDNLAARATAGVYVSNNPSTFSCVPRETPVRTGASVVIDAFNGNGPFTWTAPGNSLLPLGSDAYATVRYATEGAKNVTVRDSVGATATCSVIVSNDGGGSLACTPLNQTRVVNATASFTATGGSGNYEWSANGGQPSTGTGNRFDTAYAFVGGKTVTLTDRNTNKTAYCNVAVTPGTDDGKHLSCVSNSCTFVDGEGEDSCSPQGVTCSSIATCTFTASPRIIRNGESSELKWTCDSGADSCVITSGGTQVATGRNGTKTVSPSTTKEYTLVCDGNEANLTRSVYVIQSYIEVPPGGN